MKDFTKFTVKSSAGVSFSKVGGWKTLTLLSKRDSGKKYLF